MTGMVGTPQGDEVIKGTVRGNHTDATALGTALADDLLARGAGRILQAFGLHEQ